MNYKDRLPNENEVIESLRRYFGFLHTQINALGNLNIDRMYSQKEAGRRLDYSQDLERTINDFVNIYGYIYEHGVFNSGKTLYRGTSTKEANNLSAGTKIGGVVSASLDEQKAKRFTSYGDGAIIYVHTANGLPFVYAEDLKDYGENESECLILPFSNVKSREFYSNWNGYRYYRVELEKQELPELEDDKLDQLKKECISKFKKFEEDAKQYHELMNYADELLDKIKNGRATKEDNIKRRELLDQMFEISGPINDFKGKFQMMLQGLCGQRERDIKQKQGDLSKAQQEVNAGEPQARSDGKLGKRQEISTSLIRKIEGCKTYLKEAIPQVVEQFIKKADAFRRMEESLGVQTSISKEPITTDLNVLRDKILSSLMQRTKSSELVLEKLDISRTTAEDLLPYLITEFSQQSEEEIKKALNEKVKTVVSTCIATKLYEEKKTVEAEKDTLIQKLFKKNVLKQAKLANIDARLDFENSLLHNSNPQNRVRLMLQQMYDYAYKYYGGILPQEMVDLEKAIRQNYRNIPQEQELRKKAIEKQEALLPDVIRKKPGLFGFSRRKQEAKRLNEKTNGIIAQITETEKKEVSTKKPISDVKVSNELRAYYKFNDTLQSIYNNVKDIGQQHIQVRDDEKTI